jgi:hypothetical protein
LTQNKAKFWEKMIITFVFEKNANFFAENCAKIAENCDYNIDPRRCYFSLHSYVFNQQVFVSRKSAPRQRDATVADEVRNQV